MVKKFLGEKFMSIGKSLLPKNAREILKDKGVKTITDLEKFSKKKLIIQWVLFRAYKDLNLQLKL